MSGMQAVEMWPRFEDGAPVDIGSEALLPGGTGGCKVFRVTVDECGWSVYGFGGRTAVGGVSTRVRRPPVLGKDGKAIEPGDAVWGEDGMNWLVTAIRWDKGNHIVEATARGEVKQLKPGWLTHEEPDSWERLEEDVRRLANELHLGCQESPFCHALGRDYAACEGCPAIDVDETCGEFVISDIVARAKALAGVVGDE